MKLKFVLLLFMVAIFVLGGQACHKEKPTIINCKVVDKLSGLPIEGASVGFAEYVDYKQTLYTWKDTNTEGSVSFSSPFELGIHDVYKIDYVSKEVGYSPDLVQGETNEVLFQLVPKNGFLKLRLENNQGPPDSIYVVIYSPTVDAESPGSIGQILKKWFSFQDTLKIIEVPTVAEEQIEIYWGELAIIYPFDTAPFHDSVFITKNDTVNYTISF